MIDSTTSTILVTGGTGFVGTHLIESLLHQGFKNIHTTTFSKDQISVGEPLLPSSNIHQLDLTNAEATADLFERLRPERVFHLASLSVVSESFERSRAVLVNNLLLQSSVLEAMRRFTPKARVLIVSSGEVYGGSGEATKPLVESAPLRPKNPYAVSKAAQELLALSYFDTYGIPLVVARPFNHTGEGQTPLFVVPAFAKQVVAVERELQESIAVGDLSKERDFLDVKDVVAAYQLLIEKGVAGEVYNVSSGKSTSIDGILKMLIAQAKADVLVVQDQTRIRPSDVATVCGDSSKLQQLGWKPTHKLADTLGRILEYWRNQ